MFISGHAIRRPVVTIVAMLALVAFGIAALARLHVDEFPDVQPPVVVLTASYPGAPPETVERELVDRFEERIAGISGVTRITSSALDSLAVVVVRFAFGTDAQQAMQQIRDQIDTIRRELPPEMEEPILKRGDPTDLPVISLTLSSAARGAPELTGIVDPGIVRQLRGIPGVASVQVVGGRARELSVELRPQALQASGVSIGQVVEALQAQNVSTPVGRLTGPIEERTIRLRGRLERPEDFAQLPIGQTAGRLVRLADVADVRDGTAEPRSAALFNDEQAVGIDLLKTKEASTLSVAERVRRAVDQIRTTLPPDVQLRVVRDASQHVNRSVHDVELALLVGAALTVAVVFVFLNSWRSTVITGVALPISVLAAFIAVWACGFTLNTMSLLGLSLAIGVLIDDAIVVRENIVRHLEAGVDPVTAAHQGTDQIGLAVAATTFAIIAVFVPVAFMGGVAEQWFAPFALTIACSVLVSLFVSFSVDPMLSAHWADPRVRRHVDRDSRRTLDRFNAWFNKQADRYEVLVGWALNHRGLTIVIAAIALLVALALPAFGVIGAAFLPDHDISEFNVVLETPPGSSLAYARSKAQELGRVVRALPEVEYTYTTIGHADASDPRSSAVNEGSLYVRLKPRVARQRHQRAIEQELRREFQGVGGVTAWISADIVRKTKQVQVQLRGRDMVELQRLGRQLGEILRGVPGAVDVGLSMKQQQPELDIQLDRPLAGALGVTAGKVGRALRTAFSGVDAGDWIDPLGEIRKVTVRLQPEARERVTSLESMPVDIAHPDGTSALMPLGNVARIAPAAGPARVDHLDRERVIYVQANTEGRPLSEVIGEFNRRTRAVQLPQGYDVSHGGEREDQRGVFRRILISLGVGVVLMYFVHVIQFGSFVDPLAVMLSLPLSLVGAMLALAVTGSTLNIMSMIGLLMLMGVVAKNAILMIDVAKTAERSGVERRTAIAEAGRLRLRPILMTTFALMAGMVPVALGLGEGGDFRAPLGRVVIGGVLTSTILTLIVIPSVYDALSEWRDRLRVRWLIRTEAGSSDPARRAAGLYTRQDVARVFRPAETKM
jgi:hydrophobe/amphiphile efflux-1 (HAE1) family protein